MLAKPNVEQQRIIDCIDDNLLILPLLAAARPKCSPNAPSTQKSRYSS